MQCDKVAQRCITPVGRDSVSSISQIFRRHQRLGRTRLWSRKTFQSSRCVSRKWTIRSQPGVPSSLPPIWDAAASSASKADTHSYVRERGPVDFDPDMVHSEAPSLQLGNQMLEPVGEGPEWSWTECLAARPGIVLLPPFSHYTTLFPPISPPRCSLRANNADITLQTLAEISFRPRRRF